MANLAYINSILDEEGIGVKPPAPKPSQNSVPTKMSQEDLNSMVDEADANYDFSKSNKDVVSGIKEFAFDSADLAAAMLGGSGISEAIGVGVENPVSVATRGEEAVPIKSLSQDMKEGNYLDASLKTVGLAGDALQLGGAYTAATGAGLIPGAVMMAGGTALKFGATAVSKYGDEISDALRRLFDIDPEAAEILAKEADDIAVNGRTNKQGEPFDDAANKGQILRKANGLEINVRKKQKQAERERSSIGGNNPPEATKPELISADVDNLGLFSRTEQAVKNIDIPEDGISGKALMARLVKDSKVPNDELDHGLGLMIDPNATITRADLDKMMSKNFGVLEIPRKLSKGETHYHQYSDFRLPDAPDSDYTEYTYHLNPTRTDEVQESMRINKYDEDEIKSAKPLADNSEKGKGYIGIHSMFESVKHFDQAATNQMFHMRTSVRINKDGKRVLLIEEIQSDAFKADGGANDVSVPFKKESGYTNLALARAMRIAVDDGLDGIAVTDGVFQIRRNSGSIAVEDIVDSATSRRTVDSVDDDFGSYNDLDIVDETGQALPDPSYHTVTLESYEGGFDVSVDSKTGTIFYSEMKGLLGKKLSDVLGSKDMADQLLAAGSEPVSLSFSERIITDSGYKAVYDKRIPKRLNTIIKTMDLKDSPNVTKSDINVKPEIPIGSVSELGDEIDNTSIAGFDAYNENGPLLKTYNRLKRFSEKEMDGDDINQFDVTASESFLQEVITAARFFDEITDATIRGNLSENEILQEIVDRYPSSAITSTDELSFLDLDEVMEITVRHLLQQSGGAVTGSITRLDVEIGNMGFRSNYDAIKAAKKWLIKAPEKLDGQLKYMAESASKQIINVPNNNTVIFTPEMRDQIKAKGLPRLRKGGLVSKRT